MRELQPLRRVDRHQLYRIVADVLGQFTRLQRRHGIVLVRLLQQRLLGFAEVAEIVEKVMQRAFADNLLGLGAPQLGENLETPQGHRVRQLKEPLRNLQGGRELPIRRSQLATALAQSLHNLPATGNILQHRFGGEVAPRQRQLGAEQSRGRC